MHWKWNTKLVTPTLIYKGVVWPIRTEKVKGFFFPKTRSELFFDLMTRVDRLTIPVPNLSQPCLGRASSTVLKVGRPIVAEQNKTRSSRIRREMGQWMSRKRGQGVWWKCTSTAKHITHEDEWWERESSSGIGSSVKHPLECFVGDGRVGKRKWRCAIEITLCPATQSSSVKIGQVLMF